MIYAACQLCLGCYSRCERVGNGLEIRLRFSVMTNESARTVIEPFGLAPHLMPPSLCLVRVCLEQLQSQRAALVVHPGQGYIVLCLCLCLCLCSCVESATLKVRWFMVFCCGLLGTRDAQRDNSLASSQACMPNACQHTWSAVSHSCSGYPSIAWVSLAPSLVSKR